MNHTVVHITGKPRSEVERIIDEWVIGYTNCGRNRAIFKEFLLDGIPAEALAEKYMLTPRQTARILAGVAELLKGKI